MNNFTKEELEDLLNCCRAAYISGEINPQTPTKMKIKIQSLIDNYCEHECIHEFEIKIMQIDLCKKCNNFKFVMAARGDDDNQ